MLVPFNDATYASCLHPTILPGRILLGAEVWGRDDFEVGAVGLIGVLFAAGLESSGPSVTGFLDGVAADLMQLTGTQTIDQMPGGFPTASVRIAGRVQTDASGDTIDAVFDNFFFGPEGTTPVELVSFDVE